MPLKCDEYHGVCVFTVDGDFTGETTSALVRFAEERLDLKRNADFIVDLEKTSFIDSEALQALLWLKQRCDAAPGRLKLAAPSDLARKVLEITRLDHQFESTLDLGSALKALR